MTKFASRKHKNIEIGPISSHPLKTSRATVQLYDSGSEKPCVIFVPDGPNVIANYERLIGLLKDNFRVVCFDMPGFGYSTPAHDYDHSLDQGAATVISVMDELKIRSATLAFSCANGFYALRVAQLAPDRISRLILSQTPSLEAMHAWSKRNIPYVMHLPVFGQAVAWAVRQKAANSWYARALPKDTDIDAFKNPAMHALAHGGCFCLAGVVQGLGREDVNFGGGISTPCTILWGSLDRSHKLTDPKSILELVPHAEVIRFEASGHFPDIEQPERFMQVLVERAKIDALPSEKC
ncbi:MAG TPA: alpha/beta hydrolase [Burkholderiaceae bacterium]